MKVSLIGCGWLGTPLAEELIRKGHKVLGSTTSTGKLESLREKGIEPVLFKLDPMPMGENFNKLFDTDLLVINIPPGSRKHPPHFYKEQIKYLKYRLDTSPIHKVIFISSTSYYPNTNGLVNTSTLFDIDKGSTEAVVKGEQQISQIKQDLVILRCGGLMGVDRIPGKYFAGRETSGADTPVNYIHQTDVVRIILEMISDWPMKKKIFNAVTPTHPTRKEVYEAMQSKYNFEAPIWTEPNKINSKVVISDFEDFELKSPIDF